MVSVNHHLLTHIFRCMIHTLVRNATTVINLVIVKNDKMESIFFHFFLAFFYFHQSLFTFQVAFFHLKFLFSLFALELRLLMLHLLFSFFILLF